MEFSIDCDVFSRLSKIARNNETGQLRSIWLENLNGKMIAVATDRRIMAIEFLGEDIGPDFTMNAVVDDALIQHCDAAKPFNGSLNFAFNHLLNYTTVTSTMGYVHPGNAALPVAGDEQNLVKGWRSCLPDELPSKSVSGMYTKMERLALLASSSPSGMIIFPKKIDPDIPVVVNDIHEPNWLGVFMARPESTSIPDPVVIPSWVKR